MNKPKPILFNTDIQAILDGRRTSAWKLDSCPEDTCANRQALLDNIHYEAFRRLWDSTIQPQDKDKYSCAANPWVWVYDFKRCEKPEVENV